MKIICHRGNIDGSNPLTENSPSHIDNALNMGYDVEIDIRLDPLEKKFYLGHDDPQYYVSMLWLFQRKENLWIHCKDLNSLRVLSQSPVDFNFFWHQNDYFTLTSKKYIWTYPGQECSPNSVVVMPESFLGKSEIRKSLEYECYGICTDYPLLLK